jgi:hypothetical protein
MSRSRRFGAIAASAVMALGALLAGAAPASAHSVTPNCTSDVTTAITSSNYVFIWDGVTWFHDGPGGTVTGTVTTARQISSTISAGAEISLSDLISTVKATVSASATNSVTTTVGHLYTHSIPSNEYGNLRYGSWGYAVHWEIVYRHSNCTTTIVQTGTGTVTTVAVGWHYWSTTT